MGEGWDEQQGPGRRAGSTVRAGEQREMSSLLRLSLLQPSSSSFTSHTMAAVGEGRAATAGMELPVLDLPVGAEPGCSLTPQH